MNGRHAIIATFLLSIAFEAHAQTPVPDSRLQSPEAVVRELYRLVCVAPGDSTDWEQVRNLYIPEAVIVLRVSKDAMSTFSVQGWIDDFVAWDKKANVMERGFEEVIVRMQPMVFRDISHIFVLYDARITSSTKPPTRGVDSIDLIQKNGRWWIASIVNDLPTPEHPIPTQLQD